MIENAPMLAVGWIRAPGSTSAVEWTASAIGHLAGAEPRLERREPPLHAAQAPRELRQLALEDEDALGLDQRARRRAEHLLARRDVAGEAGLRGDDSAVTDREMVGDAHRARVDHDALAAPHPGTDGHARVHDRRLADLGARPDECQRTDPDVGPDDGARLDHGERPDRGGRRDARVAGDDR